MTSSLQLETIELIGGIHENGEISTGLPPPGNFGLDGHIGDDRISGESWELSRFLRSTSKTGG